MRPRVETQTAKFSNRSKVPSHIITTCVTIHKHPEDVAQHRYVRRGSSAEVCKKLFNKCTYTFNHTPKTLDYFRKVLSQTNLLNSQTFWRGCMWLLMRIFWRIVQEMLSSPSNPIQRSSLDYLRSFFSYYCLFIIPKKHHTNSFHEDLLQIMSQTLSKTYLITYSGYFRRDGSTSIQFWRIPSELQSLFMFNIVEQSNEFSQSPSKYEDVVKDFVCETKQHMYLTHSAPKLYFTNNCCQRILRVVKWKRLSFVL